MEFLGIGTMEEEAVGPPDVLPYAFINSSV